MVDGVGSTLRLRIYMRKGFQNFLLPLVATAAFATLDASGASVGPAGYINDFAVQPAAADWSTLSRAGAGGDTYDSDTEVNATITSAAVTAQTTSNAGSPPVQLGTATWSSTGLYLQTRPTGNRFLVLMGNFVNDTGTNASEIRVSYLLTIAGNTSPEDAGKGTRVYYSHSGEANSWTNLAELNNLSSTPGSTALSTTFAVDWTNGGSLFLAWVDDNNSGGTDVGNQIDDFSLEVTAGSLPITDLTLFLDAPTNGALFVTGTEIVAFASVLNGMAPHSVEYFTNTGVGNEIFTSAGSSAEPPFPHTRRAAEYWEDLNKV
jgi:hypothetical protein